MNDQFELIRGAKHMVLQDNDNEWKPIFPKVNSEAEFFEIVHDFGNPLELSENENLRQSLPPEDIARYR